MIVPCCFIINVVQCPLQVLNLLIVGQSVSGAVCCFSLATIAASPPHFLWLLRATVHFHHMFGSGHRQQVKGRAVEVGMQIAVQISSVVRKLSSII